MKPFRPLFWALIALLPFLLYVNCSRVSALSMQNGATEDSGGQAYDGKVYIVAGSCPDGTSVVARIEIKGGTPTLLRQNCQTTQQVLSPTDLTYASGDIVYANQTFTPETAQLPVANLKTGYFQWSGPLRAVTPQVFYMDGRGYTASDLQTAKAGGAAVICVLTAGVTQTSDPDYSQFQASDIGNIVPGTSQYWLDTRSANVRSVLLKRLDGILSKGCDGIAWDQTDAYTNNSGFPLTSDTELDFVKFLMFAARDRKLMTSMLNAGGLATQVADYFDMQYSQGCFSSGHCDQYQPFLTRGKPVFVAESVAVSTAFCDQAKASSISLWYTTANQDGTRYQTCP